MTHEHEVLARLSQLERQVRRSRILACAALLLAVLASVTLRSSAEERQSDEILRIRRLVIVDEQNRDRIIVGSPFTDASEGRRNHPATGMAIRDANGAERFGLGVNPDGGVSMGFDAPVGVGDPRNRERINIWVSPDGRGYIRFLDNHTRAKMLLHVDQEEQAWLEFPIWSPQGVVSRKKIGSE